MKTFIKNLSGEDGQFVLNTINAHQEFYGKCDTIDYIHAHFYGVYDDTNNLCAFFALCTWGYMYECLLACVYVKEEFRHQGIFSKIARFAVNKASDYTIITIGAKKDNALANDVYNHMFTFSHYDPQEDGNFYLIRDRRK